ncbi:MAG: DUF1559 domain-containing protein [Pirellulaceae bacterium]|nr:DUF1559 domain-containing protein [Pirellulaceae bacterium]
MHRSPSTPVQTIRAVICGLALAAAAPTVAADPAKDVQTVKPFVGETTIVVVKIDSQRLAAPSEDAARDLPPAARAGVGQAAKVMEEALGQLRNLADKQIVFATIGVPESKNRAAIHVFRRATTAQNTASVTAFAKVLNMKTEVRGDLLVATPAGETPPATSPNARTLAAIEAGFKSVEKYPVQVLVVPPDYLRRTVTELSPELPRQLGGGPSRVLTEGVQWAGLGVDPQKLQAEVVVESANDSAARDLAAYLPKLLNAASESLGPINSQVPTDVPKLLIDDLKPDVQGNQVRIRINGLEQTRANVVLFASMARFAESTGVNSNVQKFKQIMLAMHNYHDVYRTMPPADSRRNDQGKHNLSWRVHILPFVEQQQLYQQFHLDEPWDSPHNKKLISKMPNIYAQKIIDPTAPKMKPGHTTFLAPVGKGTIFGGAKQTSLRDVVDGTSNTVAIVNVRPEKAVPWTAPRDYEFDAKDPIAGIQIGANDRWLSGFADGRVQLLHRKLPAKTVVNLFRMNDGNVVSIE